MNVKSQDEPLEKGNAKNIEIVCLPMIKLAMLYYEEVYNFYSEEPIYINAKFNENDEKYTAYEQIFRFRYWNQNDKACSWIIYSEEREFKTKQYRQTGLIIRNVCWDKQYDIKKIKMSKGNRSLIFNSWPQTTAVNYMIRDNKVDEIVKTLQIIDETIGNGFILEINDNKNCEKEWDETEVLRLFDWGQIHNTWSSFKTNRDVEELLHNFEEQLKLISFDIKDSIDTMKLDFSCPPHIKMSLINPDYSK